MQFTYVVEKQKCSAINPWKIIDKNKKKCLLSTKSAYYNVEKYIEMYSFINGGKTVRGLCIVYMEGIYALNVSKIII